MGADGGLTGWMTAPLHWMTESRVKVVVATACWATIVTIVFSVKKGGGSTFVYSESSTAGVPWNTPMCDASGRCYEHADVASPRTGYSAWTEEQYLDWTTAQHELAAKAKARWAYSTDPPSLVLLGDSITESWVGTAYGKPVSKFADTPAAFARTKLAETFGEDPLVLGLSGDQTQHLLWRLEQGGELDPAHTASSPFVVILLIGTNNLGNGHLPAETVRGIVAVADKVLSLAPTSTLLLSAVMPRNDGEHRPDRMEKLCPPRCKSDGSPFASFAPAVKQVNDMLPDEVSKLKEKFGTDRVVFHDCSSVLLSPGENDTNSAWKQEVDPILMPDYLHPNAVGMTLWANCVAPIAARLLK